MWDIYDIYIDDDYTGSDRARPEWNRLLDDAEKHSFDIVLCKSQSRFTRELEMVEKYIHGLFPIWNIRFVSVVDNADTELKGNKKSRQINGLVNEWYLEDMSENIKSVLTNRRENGFHIGAFALYGYEKDPDKKGYLIIDEEAAAVVREVFTLFSQGYGKTNIARRLNDRGIPNPTEYKRLNGLRYKQPKCQYSTLWKYYTISNMLINEMYIGNMVQEKYGSISYKTKQNKPISKEHWIRVEKTHDPIIDNDLWNRVQTLTAQKAKPFTVGEIGLFAHKARCMYCGYVMRSSKNQGKHYLKCDTKNVSNNACIGAFASVERLEKQVLGDLQKLMDQYIDRDELKKIIAFNNSIETDIKRLENEMFYYQKKSGEYEKGIKTLYMDKIKGIITDDDFIELSREFHLDNSKYNTIIDEFQNQIALFNKKLNSADDRHKIIEQYTNITSLNRKMVDTFIDFISI